MQPRHSNHGRCRWKLKSSSFINHCRTTGTARKRSTLGNEWPIFEGQESERWGEGGPIFLTLWIRFEEREGAAAAAAAEGKEFIYGFDRIDLTEKLG